MTIKWFKERKRQRRLNKAIQEMNKYIEATQGDFVDCTTPNLWRNNFPNDDAYNKAVQEKINTPH